MSNEPPKVLQQLAVAAVVVLLLTFICSSVLLINYEGKDSNPYLTATLVSLGGIILASLVLGKKAPPK